MAYDRLGVRLLFWGGAYLGHLSCAVTYLKQGQFYRAEQRLWLAHRFFVHITRPKREMPEIAELQQRIRQVIDSYPPERQRQLFRRVAAPEFPELSRLSEAEQWVAEEIEGWLTEETTPQIRQWARVRFETLDAQLSPASRS